MKEFIIDQYNEGKNLFRFVKSVLPHLKNREIFKLIRKEVIKVNDKKTDFNQKLNRNDKVKIFMNEKNFKKQKDNKFSSIKTNFEIIFEDKDIIVINKEMGILVHPDKKEFKNTLSEMVKAYLYKKGEYKPNNFFNPAPCHRLDTNTSGIIVFAKNHNALKKVNLLFKERETIKLYRTIVYGKITTPILITSMIDTTENEENMVKVLDLKVYNIIPDKEKFLSENKFISATKMIPIKYESQYSLVDVELWTGKKHQIRAHLAAANHPILGDNKYFTKAGLSVSQLLGLKNYFLHAYKLILKGYGEWNAKFPEDFRQKAFELFKYEM
ncbi:MAG TPA: RluA family pseudouridine synthase [Spirochaetota bacterium]|nr:RluA family pseudouridine synthase [Spirochaetota bacterium]HOL56802.1 RluA family pseudouridine synthase [Spirochaetota bacterium]HPP03871.1 RluA family pseudouridine synthase [Spirochaetota bacterium]